MAGAFSGAGLGQFGRESQYIPQASEGGGLGAVAGLYLADKMGLVDLKNISEKDKESMRKNGVLSTLAMNKLTAPSGSAPAPQSSQAVIPPVVGGPMQKNSVVGVPLAPMEPIPQTPAQNLSLNTYDPENIDHSISNFAALYGRA